MRVHTFCFGGADAFALQAALLAATRDARALLPGLRDAHVHRVLRYIATDSITAQQAQLPIAPRADEIQAIVECAFEGDTASQQGFPRVLAAVRGAGELLFAFETLSNVPIAPKRQAVEGGFRRWMLLRRSADTHDSFREAWFGRHARLVKELPHVDGYFQNLVAGRFDARGEPLAYDALPVDGIAQLCYADEAAMLASYASGARAPLREDGRALHSGNVTLLVEGARA